MAKIIFNQKMGAWENYGFTGSYIHTYMCVGGAADITIFSALSITNANIMCSDNVAYAQH